MHAIRRLHPASPKQPTLIRLNADPSSRNITALRKIAFKVSEGVEFVIAGDVRYLKAESNYTRIVSRDRTPLLVSRTLKHCTSIFPGAFLRVHQSYLVNPEYIRSYKSCDAAVVLDDGKQIPVSRSGKPAVRAYIRQFLEAQVAYRR